MSRAQLTRKMMLGEQLHVAKHISQGDMTPQKYLTVQAAHIES